MAAPHSVPRYVPPLPTLPPPAVPPPPKPAPPPYAVSAPVHTPPPSHPPPFNPYLVYNSPFAPSAPPLVTPTPAPPPSLPPLDLRPPPAASAPLPVAAPRPLKLSNTALPTALSTPPLASHLLYSRLDDAAARPSERHNVLLVTAPAAAARHASPVSERAPPTELTFYRGTLSLLPGDAAAAAGAEAEREWRVREPLPRYAPLSDAPPMPVTYAPLAPAKSLSSSPPLSSAHVFSPYAPAVPPVAPRTSDPPPSEDPPDDMMLSPPYRPLS